MRKLLLKSRARLGRSAFTLVELLVVIAVLVLLAGLIASGASRMFYQQKLRATRVLMSTLDQALDVFQTENPLRGIYDQPGGNSFGPYPPYMLARRLASPTGATATDIVDPVANSMYLPPLFSDPNSSFTLTRRIYRDMGNLREGATDPGLNWARLRDNTPTDLENMSRNDNRALYAYLARYVPSALALVPEANRKPLIRGGGELISPNGTLGNLTSSTRQIDVLGFYDGWGVPLDYMLYIKVEYNIVRNASGQLVQGYRVVDRRPVFRSHGEEAEKHETGGSGSKAWIFSQDLPKPWANVTANGNLPLPTNPAAAQAAGGWLRLVAQGDDVDEPYGYLPSQD